MFHSVCDKICDNFISLNIITEERKPLYVYGMNQAFNMVLNIATTLLLGLLFDMFWSCIFFLAAFIPVRSYAGGYHARTPLRCYVFSFVQIFVILILLKYIDILFAVSLFLIVLSGFVILALAPIEDQNKPFSNGEFIEFRKRTRIILLIEMICYVLCAWRGWYFVCDSIMMAHMTLAIVLILGWIKNNVSCDGIMNKSNLVNKRD